MEERCDGQVWYEFKEPCDVHDIGIWKSILLGKERIFGDLSPICYA